MFNIFDSDFISNLPGLLITKDLNSNYISISENFARLLGWKSAYECKGKTDYDIPCKATEFAEEFIRLDKIALSTAEKMIALDIQQYALGWKLVLVHRMSVRDKNDLVVGLFNQCFDVSDIDYFKNYLIMNGWASKFSNIAKKPVSYILSQKHSPLELTDKQENCLFLLLRGKTIKEIAKQLMVSPRTIESHFEAIKLKFACDTKSQLIEKAIQSGFLYYIPKFFQDKL